MFVQVFLPIKSTRMIRFAIICTLCLFSVAAFAQDATVYPDATKVNGNSPQARKSPMEMTAMTNGDNYVAVVYSRPQLNGRDMIGGKVPYGKVWRLGANEATQLFTSTDITIGGESVPAGAYSLFAIPTEGSWTLIVNKNPIQWGAYQYDESMDQARIETTVSTTGQPFEAFTIWFAEDGSALNMAWGETMASYPIGTKG